MLIPAAGERATASTRTSPAAPAIRAPASAWPEVSDRIFWIGALAILIVAAVLRIYALSVNPFHHDEGVNGWFVTNLVRRGEWDYDPANYHGPTLFYFALVTQTLFGLTDEAMRLVPVVFGLATVGLVLALRPFVGGVAALAAAALLAISPGASYVSRYFIHESLVAFFTLGIVVALLYLVRDRRQRYLALAAASAALLFATKETGIVAVAVLAIAAVVRVVYVRIRNPASGNPADRTRGRGGRRSPASSRHGIARWPEVITTEGLIVAALVFAALYVVFFTSFLSNPQGLVDSLATFTIWTQTGTETQVQPFHQYLVWMLQADASILLLGFVGGLLVAWRAEDRVAVFVGLWALGITLAYSLVTYKTPWIALNMLVPLAILAGLAVAEIARVAEFSRRVQPRPLRAAASVVLAGALALSGYQSLDLNFVHYDDERYPYSFVHTTRDALALVGEAERIAAAAGTNEETGIVVVAPEYWPLPWYFRNYPRVGFYGQIVPTEEPIIVANVNQEAELATTIAETYRRKNVYRLRPGVDLVLYVRQDVADL